MILKNQKKVEIPIKKTKKLFRMFSYKTNLRAIKIRLKRKLRMELN